MAYPVGDRPTRQQRRLTPEEELLRLAQSSGERPASGGWDETTPDGTPAMQIGIPAWQRTVASGPRPPLGPPQPNNPLNPLPATQTPSGSTFLFQSVGDRPAPPPTPEQMQTLLPEEPPVMGARGATSLPDAGDRPVPSSVLENGTSQPTQTSAELADYNRAQARYSEAFNRPTNDRNGKLRSVLKMSGVGLQGFNNFRPGGGWGEFAARAAGVGGAALATAFHPSADEEYGRARDVRESEAGLKTVRENLSAASQLQNRSSLISSRGENLKLRQQSAAERRAYNEWRMKSGDHKQDTYDTWVAWRMKSGDRQQLSREDYYRWLREAEEGRNEDRDATRSLAEKRDARQARENTRRLDLEEQRNKIYAESVAKRDGGESSKSQIAKLEAGYYRDLAEDLNAEAATLEVSDDDLDRAEGRELRRKAKKAQMESEKRSIKTGASSLSKFTREDVVTRARARFPNDPAKQQKIIDEWEKRSSGAWIQW